MLSSTLLVVIFAYYYCICSDCYIINGVHIANNTKIRVLSQEHRAGYKINEVDGKYTLSLVNGTNGSLLDITSINQFSGLYNFRELCTYCEEWLITGFYAQPYSSLHVTFRLDFQQRYRAMNLTHFKVAAYAIVKFGLRHLEKIEEAVKRLTWNNTTLDEFQQFQHKSYAQMKELTQNTVARYLQSIHNAPTEQKAALHSLMNSYWSATYTIEKYFFLQRIEMHVSNA